MQVLISGAGVAGPTAAYWLRRIHGIDVTMVEQAPTLRTSGYIIDFWGAGYEVAERMGLLSDISAKGYHVQEVRFVGKNGQRVAGFEFKSLARMLNDRFVSLPRGVAPRRRDRVSYRLTRLEGPTSDGGTRCDAARLRPVGKILRASWPTPQQWRQDMLARPQEPASRAPYCVGRPLGGLIMRKMQNDPGATIFAPARGGRPRREGADIGASTQDRC